MSLSQRSLGCADVKSRLMRFGDALVLRESVVTRNRRIWQDLRPAHQLGHGVATARHLLGQQLDVHSRSAVRLAAGLVDRPDTSREFNPALLPVTGTALPRSVVATARDLQRLAQRRHTVLPSIVLDEGVLHFASRAK